MLRSEWPFIIIMMMMIASSKGIHVEDLGSGEDAGVTAVSRTEFS